MPDAKLQTVEHARIYRISPEYRRSCLYAVAGFWIFCFAYFFLNRSYPEYVKCDFSLAVVTVLLSIAAVIPQRWQLRIDPEGISRRRVFRRDHWPWADFSSGRIQKAPFFRLVAPHHAFGFRKLRLDLLSEEDSLELMDTINRYYQLPAAPDVPEVLELKLGFKDKYILNPQGIELIVGNITTSFEWADMISMRITRWEPRQRDFFRLEMEFPERMVYLVHIQGRPNFQGASSADVNEFLLRIIEPARIRFDTIANPRPNISDLKKKIDAEDKGNRQAKIFMSLLGLVFFGVIVRTFLDNVYLALFYTGMIILHIPVSVMVYRQKVKKDNQRKALLAKLQKEKCE